MNSLDGWMRSKLHRFGDIAWMDGWKKNYTGFKMENMDGWMKRKLHRFWDEKHGWMDEKITQFRDLKHGCN
jgi:hypothetical protein